MKIDRTAASSRLTKFAFLAVGAIGTVVVWKQCGPQEQRSRQTPVAAVAKTKGPAGGSSSPSSPGVGNDWERLLDTSPDEILRAIQKAEAHDEREEQRFKLYEVRALVKLQRIDDAKALAVLYYERWPAGPDVATLQNLTGAQPAPIIDMDKP